MNDDNADKSQFLTFLLGEEKFGIEIHQVREIIEFPGVTEIPMLPDYIPGVINLRGNVVPIVDLLVLFSKGKVEVGKRSCIVIVEISLDDNLSFAGLLVDAVHEVLAIGSVDVESVPAFGTGIQSDWLRGMGKVGGDFIILINGDMLLTLESIFQATRREASVLAPDLKLQIEDPASTTAG
jgi:purine-binding chemotaxis protein CheW